MSTETLYLDNNATTRLAPEALQAMMPYLTDAYANPSSQHGFGQAAQHAIEQARAQVADLIGARPRDMVFTSGATEADNLAIMGVLAALPDRRHIVTTSVEHMAVLHLCQRLEKRGYRVTYVPVDRQGRLDIGEFSAALGDETAIASVMHANNETGAIFPVDKLAEIAAARGIPLHVDAVQTAGKLSIDVGKMPVSLMSLSAHKMHGPKGVGALYVRRGVRLHGQQVGGHQERGLRPGTENVAGIIGFGRAAQLARAMTAADWQRIRDMRDRLEQGLTSRVRYACVNAEQNERTANTSNISFETLEAEAIIITLSERGIAASAGAACSSGSLEPSHVLTAMGLERAVAHGGVRFSLSRYTTDAEIDEALERIPPLVDRLRGLLPPGV